MTLCRSRPTLLIRGNSLGNSKLSSISYHYYSAHSISSANIHQTESLSILHERIQIYQLPWKFLYFSHPFPHQGPSKSPLHFSLPLNMGSIGNSLLFLLRFLPFIPQGLFCNFWFLGLYWLRCSIPTLIHLFPKAETQQTPNTFRVSAPSLEYAGEYFERMLPE